MKFLASVKLSEHMYKDNSGYLICQDAVLSRTGPQQYRMSELFGTDDDTIVDVYRDEAEVFDEKAMTSFENKPICDEHPSVDVNPNNYNELSVGNIRDIHRGMDDGQPVMMGTLVVTNADAIDAIENGKRQLSCGYDCDIIKDENGRYKQINIRGNHLALCEEGRAGIARIKDAKVTDSKIEEAKQLLEKNDIKVIKTTGAEGNFYLFIEDKTKAKLAKDILSKKYDNVDIYRDSSTGLSKLRVGNGAETKFSKAEVEKDIKSLGYTIIKWYTSSGDIVAVIRPDEINMDGYEWFSKQVKRKLSKYGKDVYVDDNEIVFYQPRFTDSVDDAVDKIDYEWYAERGLTKVHENSSAVVFQKGGYYSVVKKTTGKLYQWNIQNLNTAIEVADDYAERHTNDSVNDGYFSEFQSGEYKRGTFRVMKRSAFENAMKRGVLSAEEGMIYVSLDEAKKVAKELGIDYVVVNLPLSRIVGDSINDFKSYRGKRISWDRRALYGRILSENDPLTNKTTIEETSTGKVYFVSTRLLEKAIQTGEAKISDSVNDKFELSDKQANELTSILRSMNKDDLYDIAYGRPNGPWMGPTGSKSDLVDDAGYELVKLGSIQKINEKLSKYTSKRLTDSVNDSLTRQERQLCDYILENAYNGHEDAYSLLEKMRGYYSEYSDLAYRKANDVLKYFESELEMMLDCNNIDDSNERMNDTMNVNDAYWGPNDNILSKEDAIKELRTARISNGDYWDAGDTKRGYYVQIQAPGLDTYEDVRKYPRVSPKHSSNAWGRIWKDNDMIFSVEGELTIVRSKMLQFLRTLRDSIYGTFVPKYAIGSKFEFEYVDKNDILSFLGLLREYTEKDIVKSTCLCKSTLTSYYREFGDRGTIFAGFDVYLTMSVTLTNGQVVSRNDKWIGSCECKDLDRYFNGNILIFGNKVKVLRKSLIRNTKEVELSPTYTFDSKDSINDDTQHEIRQIIEHKVKEGKTADEIFTLLYNKYKGAVPARLIADEYEKVTGTKFSTKEIMKYGFRDSAYSEQSFVVYNICVKYNFYTRGTTSEYNKMLANCDTWSIGAIAQDISKHSVPQYEPYAPAKTDISAKNIAKLIKEQAAREGIKFKDSKAKDTAKFLKAIQMVKMLSKKGER